MHCQSSSKKASPQRYRGIYIDLPGHFPVRYVKLPEGSIAMWVCLKMLYPIVPNGFADHYPYEKWLFHWEY